MLLPQVLFSLHFTWSACHSWGHTPYYLHALVYLYASEEHTPTLCLYPPTNKKGSPCSYGWHHLCETYAHIWLWNSWGSGFPYNPCMTQRFAIDNVPVKKIEKLWDRPPSACWTWYSLLFLNWHLSPFKIILSLSQVLIACFIKNFNGDLSPSFSFFGYV